MATPTAEMPEGVSRLLTSSTPPGPQTSCNRTRCNPNWTVTTVQSAIADPSETAGQGRFPCHTATWPRTGLGPSSRENWGFPPRAPADLRNWFLPTWFGAASRAIADGPCSSDMAESWMTVGAPGGPHASGQVLVADWEEDGVSGIVDGHMPGTCGLVPVSLSLEDPAVGKRKVAQVDAKPVIRR